MFNRQNALIHPVTVDFLQLCFKCMQKHFFFIDMKGTLNQVFFFLFFLFCTDRKNACEQSVL